MSDKMTKIEDLTDEEIVRFLAKHCMGWHEEQPWYGNAYWVDKGEGYRTNRFNPLTSGDNMLMVIEALARKMIYIDIKPYPGLIKGEIKYEVWVDLKDPITLTADTAQRAVCLAAVKALTPKEKDDEEKT